jgi:hypothetical protein
MRNFDGPINDLACVQPPAPGSLLDFRVAAKSEVIVVTNPPSRLVDLAAAVAKYNHLTLTDETLARWCVYHRLFYRETWRVRRNLLDSSNPDARMLGDYWEDRLAQTSWHSGGFATESDQYFSNGEVVKAPNWDR